MTIRDRYDEVVDDLNFRGLIAAPSSLFWEEFRVSRGGLASYGLTLTKRGEDWFVVAAPYSLAGLRVRFE